MLARNNDGYSYDGNYKMSSLSEIAQAERRLSAKKQSLEDMQNEYNLIENQTFNTYVKNISYFQLAQKGMINASKDWLNMKKKNQDKDGNKLDGRRSYPEKTNFEYYIGYIKDLLGIDNMEDIEFYDYNFGEGCHISFTYKNNKWQLEIPLVDKIGLRSYKSYGASVFKLRLLHKDSSCCWSCVGSTFEEDELKNIMTIGIEKWCKEE